MNILANLYDRLTIKLDKETAEVLSNYMETKFNYEVENNKRLATKEDLTKFKGELEVKISESKNETIKWMFMFWVGQLVAMVSVFLVCIKK